jgi:uncharacterized coiled-coil protein SlyX
MFGNHNDSAILTVSVDECPDVVSSDEKKATAVKAFAALRGHGNGGIERNLSAAASIAALKASDLPRGEFSRFCENELRISSTYRARLLRLHEVRDQVREALDWAQTQKHRLAECQSAQNLIKVVGDWLKKDRLAEPDADSNRRKRQLSEAVKAGLKKATEETAVVVAERDRIISDLTSKVAQLNDTIDELQERLGEREDDITKLRDPLTNEVRDRALVALTSSRASEFAALAKRIHWCVNDLRRELEIEPR